MPRLNSSKTMKRSLTSRLTLIINSGRQRGKSSVVKRRGARKRRGAVVRSKLVRTERCSNTLRLMVMRASSTLDNLSTHSTEAKMTVSSSIQDNHRETLVAVIRKTVNSNTQDSHRGKLVAMNQRSVNSSTLDSHRGSHVGPECTRMNSQQICLPPGDTPNTKRERLKHNKRRNTSRRDRSDQHPHSIRESMTESLPTDASTRWVNALTGLSMKSLSSNTTCPRLNLCHSQRHTLSLTHNHNRSHSLSPPHCPRLVQCPRPVQYHTLRKTRDVLLSMLTYTLAELTRRSPKRSRLKLSHLLRSATVTRTGTTTTSISPIITTEDLATTTMRITST